MEKKQSNQFLKGTLILTVGGMIVKVIGSLNWIILSRVLGGEGIGLYQMAFPIYLLALSVSSAGIPVAISIITAERLAFQDYRGANRVFYLSLLVLAGTGLFFSGLLYTGAGWLIEQRLIRDPRAYYSLIALSPAIFFVTILSSFRGYLQGWQLMTPTAVSQIVEQIFRVGAMLIFAAMLLPKGLEYAAGGASMGAGTGAVAGLLVLIYSYWRVQQKNKEQIKAQPPAENAESNRKLLGRIIKLALPVSLSSLMLPAVANLDLFIVPLRLETAGYAVEQATELFGYLTGMAVPLVNLATIFTAALATSLVPAISREYSLGNWENIKQRIAAAMRITNLVTIPAAVILWLLAEPVCTLVYHAPQAADSVRVLSIAVYLLGLHQTTTGVLQGMGHTAIPVINMGAAAVVKVFLSWELTALPALGIQGAAWATVADMGVAALLNMYFIKRYTGFIMNWDVLWKNMIAAAVMGVILYGLYDLLAAFTSSLVISMVVSLLIAGIVYLAVMLIIGGMSFRDLGQVPLVGASLVKIGNCFGLIKNKEE